MIKINKFFREKKYEDENFMCCPAFCPTKIPYELYHSPSQKSIQKLVRRYRAKYIRVTISSLYQMPYVKRQKKGLFSKEGMIE